MGFTKIVVAGASGNLGSAILLQLLSSSDHIFEVTALTQSKSLTAESCVSRLGLSPAYSKNLAIICVDYGDEEELARVFTGVDVAIAALASSVALQLDPVLLNAARKVGVQRYVPSQYTLDVLHPNALALFSEGWAAAPEIALAQRYEALAKEDGVTSHTTILTSMFLDVFLEYGIFGSFDIRNKKAVVVDGGMAHFTACSTEFIGAAIVALLKLPEEETRNKRIPIAEVRITANELIETIEDVFGFKTDVDNKTSAQVMQERREALARKDFRGVHASTVTKLVSDGSGAGDLVEGMAFDADGALTFQRRSLKDLVSLVKSRMES